jgi:hypothetical protein
MLFPQVLREGFTLIYSSFQLQLCNHTDQSVEALRYKSEGGVFNSRLCHWNFSLTYYSGRTVALWSDQPLTEMSNRNISLGVKAAGV